MSRIHNINPSRIKWCCDERGITVDALADAAGIPRKTISEVMTAEDGLTFNQLHSIAEYFNRGTLFFLEQRPIEETRVHTEQYRTIANKKPEIDGSIKALIERVELQRDRYLALREELGENEHPVFAPPEIGKTVRGRAATIVRQWLALGIKNDFDSYRGAIEAKGILVFRSNGYAGDWQIAKKSKICGLSIFHDRCPVIVVKKQARESRQVFTLMHELAHLILDRSSFLDDETDLNSYEGNERFANAFAGGLLVPDGLLALIDDRARPDDVAGYDLWLRKFRNSWGVSSDVILRRLRDAGRLGKREYDEFCTLRATYTPPEDDRGNRKYRYREPKHVFGDPYVTTVLEALSGRRITLAKASTYLDNLKIKDVHQLERLYVGV